MTSLTNAAAAEAPPAILIPPLPNDVAVQCLARVPRRYHPVLAAVSKPIRSLISSTKFFEERSRHNCTEILPYLMIQNGDCQAEVWFTIRRRPNPNSNTGDFIIARISGAVPDDDLDCSKCAAVGPKIYVLGSRTDLWIFDCRFHAWERGPSIPTAPLDLDPFMDLDCVKCVAVGTKIYVLGSRTHLRIFDCLFREWKLGPSMPTALSVDTKTVVLGTKIFVMQWSMVMTGRADVFDTVAGQWKAGEKVKVNHEAMIWEVLESGIRSRVPWFYPMCEVNGVSCCYDLCTGQLKCLDEITGVWKELKCVKKKLRFQWKEVQMSNVGGSLAVSGWRVSRNNGRTMAINYLEIEVKKDQDGDFWGEVLLWSEKVHSTCMAPKYTCTPVSL